MESSHAAAGRSGSSRCPEAARSPDGYDASAFPSFAVTVDILILTVVEAQLQVLLVRRKADPFEGAWALPGGSNGQTNRSTRLRPVVGRTATDQERATETPAVPAVSAHGLTCR